MTTNKISIMEVSIFIYLFLLSLILFDTQFHVKVKNNETVLNDRILIKLI